MKVKPKTVGIIGGTGGMGKLFKKIFLSHKHKVISASRRTAISIEDIISFMKGKISPLVIVSSSLRKCGRYFLCVSLVSEP